jgi:hypothetical protein
MQKEIPCPVTVAAEKISGNAVDCADKGKCNNHSSCVLVREYGSWENLVQHFVELANETSRLEDDFLKSLESH